MSEKRQQQLQDRPLQQQPLDPPQQQQQKPQQRGKISWKKNVGLDLALEDCSLPRKSKEWFDEESMSLSDDEQSTWLSCWKKKKTTVRPVDGRRGGRGGGGVGGKRGGGRGEAKNKDVRGTGIATGGRREANRLENIHALPPVEAPPLNTPSEEAAIGQLTTSWSYPWDIWAERTDEDKRNGR